MLRKDHDPFEHEAAEAPQKIAGGLSRIGLAMRHQSWRAAGERGLTPTQGQVLAFLAGRPGQALRLGEIVDALALTAATVSEAVRVLVEKGLVSKERDSSDARALRLVLTERGLDEASRAAHWSDFLAAASHVLEPAEQAAFLKGLIKMIRELQMRGQIPVQRMCVSCQYFRAEVHSGDERPHHCMLVNAPMGDGEMRLDCPEQQAAPQELAGENWLKFIGMLKDSGER
jgi:DNA-binding MarR family transcriptional regulator